MTNLLTIDPNFQQDIRLCFGKNPQMLHGTKGIFTLVIYHRF